MLSHYPWIWFDILIFCPFYIYWDSVDLKQKIDTYLFKLSFQRSDLAFQTMPKLCLNQFSDDNVVAAAAAVVVETRRKANLKWNSSLSLSVMLMLKNLEHNLINLTKNCNLKLQLRILNYLKIDANIQWKTLTQKFYLKLLPYVYFILLNI